MSKKIMVLAVCLLTGASLSLVSYPASRSFASDIDNDLFARNLMHREVNYAERIDAPRILVESVGREPMLYKDGDSYFEVHNQLLNGDFEQGNQHWTERRLIDNTTYDATGQIIQSNLHTGGFGNYFAYLNGWDWLASEPFYIPNNTTAVLVSYSYRLVHWGSCAHGFNGVGVYLVNEGTMPDILLTVHQPKTDDYDQKYEAKILYPFETREEITPLYGEDFNLSFHSRTQDPNCSFALYLDNVSVIISVDTTKYHNFVTRLYTRALGRSAETSGVDYWYGRLYWAESTKLELIDAFIRTPEYYRTYTRGIYEEFMGRTADTPGLNYWTGRMEQGLTKVQLIEQFAYSPEYLGQSPSKFVDALYQNFMNRKADTAGKNFYLNRMASQGNSEVAKREVIQDFLYSYEFNAKYVQEEYQSILGRKTDSTGEQFFVGQLQQGLDRLQLTAQLLDSQEFWNK